MSEPVVRRRVVVEGRVQGVFYRDSCRQEARRLGLVGWVRNRSDGTVELEAQGTPADVDALVAWCRTGPPRAVVTSVRVDDATPARDTSFRIAAST